MFELNGSDTSWLVYADYLEDQDIDAAHIREGVADPQTNQWIVLYRRNNVGVDYSERGVGCSSHAVGCGFTSPGSNFDAIDYVGGLITTGVGR
jgi:uncharacterized protein (TIGR02996 family)